MAAISLLALLGPAPALKRRRGRPPTRRRRQAARTLVTDPPPTHGAPKHYDVDDAELVALVDNWKKQAKRQDLPDTRALAELLFHYAPPDVRQQLEDRLAYHDRRAETPYARANALRRAVAEVTPLGKGPDFSWWVQRLDRARRTLRRRSRISRDL